MGLYDTISCIYVQFVYSQDASAKSSFISLIRFLILHVGRVDKTALKRIAIVLNRQNSEKYIW